MFDLGYMIDSITYLILDAIPVLMSIAVMVFFWGIVKFMTHAGDERSHDQGKNLMIWGMVGLFVMVALWGIVGYIQDTLNIGFGGGVNYPDLPTYLP